MGVAGQRDGGQDTVGVKEPLNGGGRQITSVSHYLTNHRADEQPDEGFGKL
jgi:hypothetical protein